jgi:hypothetical protein
VPLSLGEIEEGAFSISKKLQNWRQISVSEGVANAKTVWRDAVVPELFALE